MDSQFENNLYQLWDYRQRVSEIYYRIRNYQAHENLEQLHQWHIGQRENLISTHTQSALDPLQQERFTGLNYYSYRNDLRFEVQPDFNVDKEIFDIPLQQDGLFQIERFARIEFQAENTKVSLYLYWVNGYGGGVFLPFRDRSNQMGETYEGGRYLIDSMKGLI